MTSLRPCQRTSVTEEEALAVGCELCGSPAGKRCTYLVPGYVRRGGKVVPNTGLETTYPHNQRRRAARKARYTNACTCWCQVRPKVCRLRCCECIKHRERPK
jgi:hypothetical protein